MEEAIRILYEPVPSAQIQRQNLKKIAKMYYEGEGVEKDIGKAEFYDRIRILLSKEIQTLVSDLNLIEHRYERIRRMGADLGKKESI